jgi:hypothetical protein
VPRRTKRWQAKFHPMMRYIDQMADGMTASGQEPRKHHLVPRFYLNRWSEQGKVRVTDLDNRRTFTPSPENAARRTDFYRLEDGTFQSGSPVAWEAFLSVLEGRVSTTTEALIDGSSSLSNLSLAELDELVWFLATQYTRGMSFRRGLKWHLVQSHLVKYEISGDEALRRRLAEAGYEISGENVARMRQQLDEMRADPGKLPMLTAMKVQQSADAAKQIYPHLADRLPVVYRTPRRLVTCDEPVVALDEDMSASVGQFGVKNAPIIVYPLAPDMLLALFRRDFPVRLGANECLTFDEVLALNQSILGNSYMYGFELPSMQLTTRLYIPPMSLNGERVTVSVEANGEKTQRLIPSDRRWRGQPHAPLRPVARWWASSI